MRDRLIELLKQCSCHYSPPCDGECYECHNVEMSDRGIEHIADRLLAAGVILPPCKVGDVVYFVSRGEIIPMVVNCISFNGNYQYCLTCNYADEEEHGYSSLSFTDRVRGYMFGFTKEEAERALAERSESDG